MSLFGRCLFIFVLQVLYFFPAAIVNKQHETGRPLGGCRAALILKTTLRRERYNIIHNMQSRRAAN